MTSAWHRRSSGHEMKHLPRIASLFLVLVAVMACGCEEGTINWAHLRQIIQQPFYPPPPPQSPPEHAAAVRAETPAPTAPRHVAHRTHPAHRRAIAKATPTPAEESPGPAPTITLKDDSPSLDRVHAESLFAQTKARFASIDRNALSSSDTTIYDQAGYFLNAASDALRNDNYSVASGFVTKASLLTNRLAQTYPGR
jgi:hypothetical protein